MKPTAFSAPIGPPMNIRYSYVKKDSLQFLWDPPESKLRRGLINGYDAEIRENDKTKTLSVGDNPM